MTQAPLRAARAACCLAFAVSAACHTSETEAPPGPPTTLAVFSGNAQHAFAGGAPAQPIVFRVTDKDGRGVPNATVSFAVTAGGGSLGATTTSVTDGSGQISAPTWTLGKSNVPQSIVATSGTFTATATAIVLTTYQIDLRTFGPTIDPTILAAFTSAARRIEGIVTGHLADSAAPDTGLDVAGQCGATGTPRLFGALHDVIIYANVDSIDGVGKIVGATFACFIRQGTRQPLISVMTFDVADLQNLLTTGRLNDVILHEMLHGIGFGTNWFGLNLITGAGTTSSAYVGQQGLAACQLLGGGANCTTSVPPELCGGSGTRDVHWREGTLNPTVSCPAGISHTAFGFLTELMTGFVSAPGTPNPFSRMTIAALGDLGYNINVLPADAYAVPSAIGASYSRIATAQGMEVEGLTDRVSEPIASLDAFGHVTKLSRRQ